MLEILNFNLKYNESFLLTVDVKLKKPLTQKRVNLLVILK